MVKTKVTAAELMARLRSDPEYSKVQADRDEKIAETAKRIRVEQAELLADLNSVGFSIESIWDLVNTSHSYAAAIPILLHHLERDYSDQILEAIARALATPDATIAWQTLMEKYKSAPKGSRVKNGLAAALSVVCPENSIDELVRLVQDSSNGESRILLLVRLKKSNSEIALDVLNKIKDDPVFSKEISSWKRKLR